MEASHDDRVSRSILAVERRTQHAPKHVTNDATMFSLVCNGLRDRGYQVDVLGEDRLAERLAKESIPERVISMAQRPENVVLLALMEEKGAQVVNSPLSVANCYRTRLTPILEKIGAPVPRSIVVRCGKARYDELNRKLGTAFWVKRGDVHAAHQDDVRLISSQAELDDVVEGFRARGVGSLVAQEHVEGEIVKFYAVRPRAFFTAFRFGTTEAYDGPTVDIEIESDRIAERLGLVIYGGDVIVQPDGGFVFIDFNPWPSFGTAREAAAPVMVEEINRMFVVAESTPTEGYGHIGGTVS